jgi:hypothetical protein
MQRLSCVFALLAGCATTGQAPRDMDQEADFSGAGDDGGASEDLASAFDHGPGDLTAAVPALTDLVPQVTFIAVGRSFPLTAVFADRYFGQPAVPVAFSSSDPTIVMVPATGQLAFNMSQAQVMAAGVKVGDATVTATVNGVMKTATVHVVPSLQDLAPSPLKVQVGMSGTLTVTLSSAALPGGADVMLQSADPNIATVPMKVTVPEGMLSAPVMVTGVAIGQVAVTASYASSMKTAQVMAIVPVTRLVVSEVLYDAKGVDDGYEWVELFNGSNAPVDLLGYFLGTTASSMTVAYSAVTPALSGTLQPGGCVVVGGPMADPMTNALPANFVFAPALKFNPNLVNGTMTTAVGLALFKGAPGMINQAMMVDAVIYGTLQRGIADETGMTNRLDVDYVKFPAQTLERFGPLQWRVQNTPTGGACDWLHL